MSSSTTAPTDVSAHHVETILNYACDAGQKPRLDPHASPEDSKKQAVTIVRHPVRVIDARSLDRPPSLDIEGFDRVAVDDHGIDFYDAARVRDVYYPEVERLVAAATGAVRVEAFDHNLRSATLAERGEHGAQWPVKFAHNDYTEKSGPQRVRDLFPDEADALIDCRFAVINVWKPTRETVHDTPLAVCDASSIGENELIASDLQYQDRTGEIHSLAYSPGQRWYYYSSMEPGEAMLLKCYDSMTDGRARFTAHSAFRDPAAPPDAPVRESIEVRTLAFFAS
ncbi:MAG: methyltransferase [Myxococcales bacterium]|jgi:hypothetical protein|nr:MAG: methyltransferase [Myxococcales bacterium]